MIEFLSMQSSFYHVQINIDFDNVSFYKELFSFLGWSVIFETEDIIGFKSEHSGDIWFVDGSVKEQVDYDKLGINHLAIRVQKQSDIDDCTSFLETKNIDPLFDTPKHRSEFSSSADETYYQVMFKSVDNILFEVVYIGQK